ncbi:MAG TPA: BatA domain-containing protein [Opitutaceae bacterium]|nr:BatA domain-containing protein [Opitutaceae bacterium]
MLPTFANPAGFWALLAVPAILAIHFLQQRSRRAVTSTWFLIEPFAPRSVGGRTWEKLRSSRALWLQLLAALLGTWLLTEPRWPRAESAQTVVLLLDSSSAMEAFREPALEAARREFDAADGLAARTTWVVMTTDPRQPTLYRGPDRNAALAAFPLWQPELGTHDLAPALRLAHSLAGGAGRTLLVTDARGKVPPGERAAGVGRALENVGFAGSNFTRDDAGLIWRAFVQNRAGSPQRRTWWIETPGGRTPPRELEIAAGAFVEVNGVFPDGVEQCTVVLEGDKFAADDRLPLVRPAAKPIAVALEGEDAAAKFFRKLAGGIDGVAFVAPAAAALRIARARADELTAEKHGGIFWPQPDQRSTASIMSEPITAERHPLVADLNWQGWIGTGPHGYAAAPADTPLLWQGRWPLVFLRTTSAGARQLRLAFDWETSNAGRLPATVLLVRRFIEAERDLQPAPYAANFDAAAPIVLQGVPPEGALTLAFQPAGGGDAATRPLSPAERAGLHAPGRAGFFTLKRDSEVVLRGATQFADARQGDFSAAETFVQDQPAERRAAMERLTRPDPFVRLWLLLLVGLALGSWWTRGGGAPGS